MDWQFTAKRSVLLVIVSRKLAMVVKFSERVTRGNGMKHGWKYDQLYVASSCEFLPQTD